MITEDQIRQLEELGIHHRTGTDIRNMEITKPPFIVDSYLPRQAVTVLSGEGGVGKSFISLYMAICVANGLPFFGKAVEQGPVVIWDAENRPEYDIKPRLDGMCRWMESMGSDISTNNIIIPDFKRTTPLSDDSGIELLRVNCEIYKPALVILDSLTDYVHGDMDKSELMVGIFNNIKHVLREHDNAMLILHHWNKGGQGYDRGDRLRGASGIRDATSSHIAADKRRGHIVLYHEKANCSELQDKLYIDISFSGDSMISLDGSAEVKDAARPKKTDSQKAAILEVLSKEEQTRSELADKLGLTKASVQRIVAELKKSGDIVDAQAVGKSVKLTLAKAEIQDS